MARREFQLIDGSSKKFWAVEVDGTTQKVHYGRIGTTGQAQEKTFPTEAEATKETDKLIAEKVKKVYTEVSAGGATAPAPAPKPKKATPPEPEPEEAPAPPPATAPAPTITRHIDLDPEDIERAAWPRVWKPLPSCSNCGSVRRRRRSRGNGSMTTSAARWRG
jgi:predicted DNA-binding WGR domain protein